MIEQRHNLEISIDAHYDDGPRDQKSQIIKRRG